MADIAQCCTVDEFQPLPFTIVPAWIKRSLLGRSTFGCLQTLPVPGLNAYTSLVELLDSPWRVERFWTLDIAEVERRLVDFVGPSTFEHLCVALLQLEHPNEIWEHVGGSGDGGLDGVASLAADPSRVVGVLQCKWAYWDKPIVIAEPQSDAHPRQILATLLHPDVVTPIDGMELWTRQIIAELVIKHAAILPIVMTMRVGRDFPAAK
ncbi:MAG: restriction endonuclease [Janthinobacterium lividum]